MRLRRARRGGVLISSIAFVAVTSILVVGMLTMAVSFYARVQTESDFENALALAEAGVNYELRAVSLNTANADQKADNPQGITYSLGSGTFSVYCMNKDGTTPWLSPNNLYIVSTGTIHGVSRTIQVSCKGYVPASPTYSIYAVNLATLSGSNTVITGPVGTDGHISATGHASINGPVEFDGLSTGWLGSSTTGSTVTYLPNPIAWPTVSALALKQFPSGGLGWLATHNDNALVPSIVNNKLIVSSGATPVLIGKAGGANYYLTDLNVSGQSGLSFDNTAGPITIWLGPLNGSGYSTISGGGSSVKGDPTKAVRIYSSLKTTFSISGSSELDAGIYVYDISGLTAIGTVDDTGGSSLQGTLLANTLTVSGGSSVSATFTYFNSDGSTANYYGYDDQWLELNPYY